MTRITSVRLRKLDINTHKTTLIEISIGLKRMNTGMLHTVTHSTFYDRVVTLTKICQKFISSTSQGIAR